MDFASALANLEKTAKTAAAAAQTTNNNSPRRSPHHSRRGRGGGGGDVRSHRSPRNHPYESPHPHQQHHRRDYSHNNGGSRQQQSHSQQHPHSHRHAWEALARFGYQVEPYKSLAPPEDWGKRPFHLALLAITIDELPFEAIWKAWAAAADNGDTNTDHGVIVSLLCHAKFPAQVKSPWLQQRLLVHPPRMGRGHSYADPVYLTHTPEWGSVQITRAMVDLLAAAMQIGLDTERDVRFSSNRFCVNRDVTASTVLPPVDKVIFISETCLPVTSLEECRMALFEETSVVMDDPTTTVGTTTVSASSKEEDHSSALHESSKPAAADAPLADTDAAITGADEPTTDAPSAPTDESTAAMPATQQKEASKPTRTVSPWEVSWVNARNRNTPGTPRNKYERDQFADLHRMVPQECRWKADQWVVLSRPHAQAILRIDCHFRPADQFWNSFCGINASDEMYFATALAVLGILQSDSNDGAATDQQVLRRPVTYTDWTEGMRNPASFLKSDFLRIGKQARSLGCLFARKFPITAAPQGQEASTLSVEEWKSFMEQLTQSER